MEYIKKYFNKYTEGLNKIDLKKIDLVVNLLYNAWKNDKQVFIMGNGGSAATASHMACDFSKGTVKDFENLNTKRFKVLSLSDNIAILTAIGNDLGYENVFSEQLKNFAKPGDIAILISASGNSPNVVKAAESARNLGVTSIGFLGFDGGKLKNLVNHAVVFEEKHYGRVEDFHMMLDHIITERLKEMFEKNI